MNEQIILSDYLEYSIEGLNNMILTYSVELGEYVELNDVNDESLMFIEFTSELSEYNAIKQFNINFDKAIKPVIIDVLNKNKLVFNNRNYIKHRVLSPTKNEIHYDVRFWFK